MLGFEPKLKHEIELSIMLYTYETNRCGGTGHCFNNIVIINDIVRSNFLMPCLVSRNNCVLLRFMSYNSLCFILVVITCDTL